MNQSDFPTTYIVDKDVEVLLEIKQTPDKQWHMHSKFTLFGDTFKNRFKIRGDDFSEAFTHLITHATTTVMDRKAFEGKKES